MLSLVLKLTAVFTGAFWMGFSGAMMPGPLLTVTVDESVRRGAAAGPLIVFGHAVLEAVLVAALSLGLLPFLRDPLAISLIGLGGGVVLCWMGRGMIVSVRTLPVQSARDARPRRMHPVVAGALVSLSNPYWTLWWVTIGLSSLMVGLQLGVAGVIVFFAGHILSDFTWYTLVGIGVARGRRFFSDTAYRRFVLVCGLALVAFGVWFAAAGLGGVSVRS